jgi:hypothetical protein
MNAIHIFTHLIFVEMDSGLALMQKQLWDWYSMKVDPVVSWLQYRYIFLALSNCDCWMLIWASSVLSSAYRSSPYLLFYSSAQYFSAWFYLASLPFSAANLPFFVSSPWYDFKSYFLFCYINYSDEQTLILMITSLDRLIFARDM